MCARFPWKFDVQTSYKPSNYVLGLILVVYIKFPRVPLTEELCFLNGGVVFTFICVWEYS